uniref:Amidase domain-containing protein n=1 Tax=Bionectria ochroleuca TaxID=29856 RepID=A0A8H7TPR6_BIOOC
MVKSPLVSPKATSIMNPGIREQPQPRYSGIELFHVFPGEVTLATPTSSVVALANGSFAITSAEVYPLRTHPTPASIQPTTVITISRSQLSPEGIAAIVARFEATDDVWDRTFLPSIIFSLEFVTPDLLPLLSITWVLWAQLAIEYLNVSTTEAAPNLAIGIPSRLYFPYTPDKPLNGLRVAIKDNINIEGSKTFGSCRAYGELYGICSETAPAIQKLIDLGAIVVGKTGLSQFADAEDATGDFVDFHAPWNPRGDGNRSPGGSSFGSGVAAGAYDWIDFTVGTNTGGIVRQPAASQSVFGLRPSRGVLALEGTLVIHSDLDAIEILSSKLEVVELVSRSWYGNPDLRSELTRVAEPPVAALEQILGIERTAIDFRREWEKSGNSNQAYEEYFEPVFNDYVAWGQHVGRASFRDDYKRKFGRPPYVNPVTQFRWKHGSEMSQGHFDSIRTKRQEFQDFVETIFGSNAIMVTPFKHGEPEARDVYRPEPFSRDPAEFGWGLRPAFQSPLAGQPEIVFPVAQLPVLSTTSLREELYGVMASLIGSKGMDITLIQLTKIVLAKLGLPNKVLTGPQPFRKTPTLNSSQLIQIPLEPFKKVAFASSYIMAFLCS